MGLQTEIRLTGAGQHASNGLVERAVQTVRRLANCLRSFAEERARLSILINRYRVLEGVGRTSYELATGHEYRGKLVLFGEVVMYKRMIKHKGSKVFEQGIWCGKHSFNDCHIVLTPEGACEARTIRRLAPEQAFDGPALITCRGLPWAYSPQGILMKHGGQAQKYRQPTLEAEIQPEELDDIAQTVAAGLVTPAPGLHVGQGQQGTGVAAPTTPALPNPSTKRQQEEIEGERLLKRQDTTESPRKSAEKREAEEAEEEAEKRKKMEESSEGKLGDAEVHVDEQKDAVGSTRPAEHEAEGTPSGKIARLYPPHYAGIQSVEVHGDEELGLEHIPEEMNEEMQYSYGGEEDGDPPEVTQEELDTLDKEATRVEIERMLKIPPAMEESTSEEVKACSGYTISTRLVYTWKHRLEQGGWFRRARLVARQFKGSVDAEQTFAPTSLMIIPKMMIHVLLNVCAGFVAMTLDIKDAFLMADQPVEEKAFIKIGEKVFRLLRCLPGQRTAASQWFQLFSQAFKEFKLEQDMMQPTLFLRQGNMYLTVRVDDVFMVGTPQILQEFVMFLKNVKKWKVEAKGPFTAGEKFLYLKRQFKITEDHCDIRCDRKQYYGLEKELDLFCRAYRKTPLDQNFTRKDDSPLLEADEVTKFRSIVGRLMYMASERPDVWQRKCQRLQNRL